MALGLLFILLFAFVQQSQSFTGFPRPRITDFSVSSSTIDVGEPVDFIWTISGSFDTAIVSFGDGNQSQLTMIRENETYSLKHSYIMEGKYNASIYVANSLNGHEDWIAHLITVQNNPPTFDISLQPQAKEDEIVNISSSNLQESEHDMQFGVLTYVFDTSDGNQTTTNSSSILHKWTNEGTYPVVVTIIDDQGALNQKVKDIVISNKAPDPDFTIGSEIPATYSFGADLIGSLPFGWNLMNNESNNAFTVIEGTDGHQKILEIKTHQSSNVGIYNTFRPQSFGSVEFWFMSTNISSSVGVFSFKDSNKIDQFVVFTKNSWWYYRTGSRDILIPNLKLLNNTWHHVRIDFLTKGQYVALSPNTFRITIDKIESRLINFQGNDIEQFHIFTGSEYSGSKAYIDAIGYSWTNFYNVGDNQHVFIEDYYATFDFSEEIIGTEPNEEYWSLDTPLSPKDGIFSIVDIGESSVREAVEIRDNSSSASLTMENNYTDQGYGSLEFWILSKDTSSKTWAILLMQNDILAIAFLIDDNEWKYTLNTIDYYTIQGLGSPENNMWYHVRIDFRCTGAKSYFDLQENEFKININSVESEQYTFTLLTSINKTRITTGRRDKGVAYLDSLGYSWDPYYDVGDNKFPIIQYLGKSKIWFSASPTTDSESDLDSLEYYWNFGDGAGDGSGDFGKYMSHAYINSGKYQVELTVMDDNGKKVSKTRTIIINNAYPNIEFASSQDEIIIYEGTTVTFDTIISDDSVDIPRMEYFWHLGGSGFDPYDTQLYEQGGWVNSYTFPDDHDGILWAMARDPEHAFDVDSINVTVVNVDPSISIRTLDMIANITFEVERSGPPWYDNNFTFIVMGTDKFDLEVPYLFTELNFGSSTDPVVNIKKENAIFDLLKDWKLYVNTTSQIFGTVQYTVTLEFQDGKQEVVQSQVFSSGSAYWEETLDRLWYDETNFTIRHPVEAGISLWDPSEDDLNLDLSYSVDMVVEVQYSDSTPISTSFNISDTYFYDIEVYEVDGKMFANISANTIIASSDIFNNNGFPVSINNASYSINPMIDLTELLVTNSEGPQLSGFFVVGCISAINFLESFVEDDDRGNSSVVIDFNTQDDVEVFNLSPDITLIHNDGGLMGQNITFYLDYYYRSYYRNHANMIFDSISTLGDVQQQVASFEYGNQVIENGTGGGSGYVATSQSTDFQVNLGNTGGINGIGTPTNVAGSSGGSAPPVYATAVASGNGLDWMTYSSGTPFLYGTYTYTNLNDYVESSYTDLIYHYPGNPGNSWATAGDWPGGWAEVDRNGYITRYPGNVQSHIGLAKIYYDGSGLSSQIYRNVGEITSGRVEGWVFTNGPDAIVELTDGGKFDIVLQFNENSVYYYNWWGLGWEWIDFASGYTGYTESEWHRFVIILKSNNYFNFYLFNLDGDLKASVHSRFSETAGSVDRVTLRTETNSPAGAVWYDGVGLTWDSGYVDDQNWFPYQTYTKYMILPMASMNKDNYNRATSVQAYVKWKVDWNTFFIPGSPIFRVSVRPSNAFGYTEVFSKTNALDNTWYYTTIDIGRYYVPNYQLDFKFEAIYTGDINDRAFPYTVYIYDVQTSWQETRQGGSNNKYYYFNAGQEASVQHTLDLSSNNFQRDYGTFNFDLSWTTSFAKAYYVDLYDFSINNWALGVLGPYNLGDGGTQSAIFNNLPLKYIEDDSDPRLIYRLRTIGGGNPFTLTINSMNVVWSYYNEYPSEFEMIFFDLTEIRRQHLIFPGTNVTFTYSGSPQLQFSLYKYGTGYVTFNPNWGGGSGSRVLGFQNTDYVEYGTNKVRVRQIMQTHDSPISISSLTYNYAWDWTYYTEYSRELVGMNDFRYDQLTLGEVTYGVQTWVGETLNVSMYNQEASKWDVLDTISTSGGMASAYDALSFTDNKYIFYDEPSGKYYVKIQFSGFADPDATKLNCIELDPEWDYSYSWDDEFEVSLTDINEFRYDNFEDSTLSYMISTRAGKDVTVSLWNYTVSDWVPQGSPITAGSEYQDSVYFTSNDYIDSTTYKVKIKFSGFSGTEFTLNSTSTTWDYTYSYYPAYQIQLDQLNSFRYTNFNESTISYQIDLPIAGKSTDIYLYNFTKLDWDYFKTTTGGANDIQDSFTFTSIDYINSGSYTTIIKFTGFSGTEFNRDSIIVNYSWVYNVQDKYYSVLNEMTTHRYNSFEKGSITFSMQTTKNQTLQVELYNFISSEWTVVGSPFNTVKDTDYNGSFVFTSEEFIDPANYKIRVYFRGISDAFLTLNAIENNYSWSHYFTYTDFGYDNQGMEGEPYANMSTIYRNVYKTYEIFNYAGNYVVTWNVSDGMLETQGGLLIEIIYPIPSVSIGELPDYILEDQEVPLESTIKFVEQFAQEAKYQFFWDFGDGQYSVDRNPLHRWSESGIYTVIFHVRDLYGYYYNDTITVEVNEIYPEIIGPLTFYGWEGQSIILDVEVTDSLFDLRDLTFTWYDENDQELTSLENNRKPTIRLPDGTYIYSLKIEDLDNIQHKKNISIIVEDLPPSVYVSNYMYQGNGASGTLTLTAYGYDSLFDINNLEFTWKISYDGTDDIRGPLPNINRSAIQFDTAKTALYQGEVQVRDKDTNKSTTTSFKISSVIDSNGNGFSDEFEERLKENKESLHDFFDSDRDGLSDLYEITNKITDWTDPDSDRDGLYDGVDRLSGVGEATVGTDPADWDTDNDLLSDSIEVFGWQMETEMFGIIYVTSNPLVADTDGDGWDDKREYDERTDPRNPDTDGDLLNDPDDPYPLKLDGDEDGLSDKVELDIGTNPNEIDTDSDGLTDGQEILGWEFITDPLTADSDRDFVYDNAEVTSYEYELQNRLSLDQPVSVKFQRSFKKAASGQIEFTIAFGEANDSVPVSGEQTTYGILDVPNVEVLITKSGVELFRGITSGTRYFSQVVDIREIMELNSANYYGNYDIRINDTDAGCILEQFKLSAVRYLDPNNNDLDGDGIMDGVEMDLIVRGTNIIDMGDSYDYNNIIINGIYQEQENYNFQIEVGYVDLTNTIDQSVSASISFNYLYYQPVVVAYVMTRNNDESVEVRVVNVTAEGFDIFMEEPDNGGHATETIGYIVVEEGEWEFPDGTVLKAGIVYTDQSHQGPSPYDNWEEVTFRTPFIKKPVMLHSLNTYNNRAFKTSIVSGVSPLSFNITQESAESGTYTEGEMIAWIAFESQKVGSVNGIKYETTVGSDGNADGVDEDGHTFTYSQNFGQTPIVVVKQNSANDEDGSWARSDGLYTPVNHRTNVEEDQVGDGERLHPDEYFGIVAFGEAFHYGYNYVYNGTSYFGVISVEHVELTLTGTSNSIQLTKQQNITNIVPFVTMKQDEGDDWDGITSDVYFTDTGTPTVHAERVRSTASVTLSIYVVEFDGITIKVQSGFFSSTATYVDKGIDEVDLLKAVPMAYYKVSGGDDDWDHAMVTTDFADSTTIHMERDQDSGTMTGHYYVFEAQNKELYVQKVELNMVSIVDTATAPIFPIDMDKTFIISSYEVDAANNDPKESAVDVWLNSASEVRAERHPDANTYAVPTINVFIVTFTGDGNVQRGSFTWQTTNTFKQQDITEVNQDLSLIKSGQMYGIGLSDGNGGSSDDLQSAFIEHKFVDNNTIRLERYNVRNLAAVGHWEVIEFVTPEIIEPLEVEQTMPEEPQIDNQYFSIVIPDRGTVYDANITLTVESESTPLGYGTVNITLFKEDINGNIDDVVLIDYDTKFNITDVYFNQFIDLTNLVTSETIYQFYGSYRLEITIFDSGFENDVFNVTQFAIQTDTYIDASASDTDAWITDPARSDTDGDSISDYDEIYGWTRDSTTFYTNPMSKDTDGDGAKDIIDRHPTENVMIKITPLSATHRNQAFWEASPKLEIVISYELNGDVDDRHKIFSPKIKATEDLWSQYIFPFLYSHYRRTNFAKNGINYYVDVDDNPNVQPENMDFGFSLWHMDVVDFFGIPLWDNSFASESVVYSIGDIGHSTTFDIYDVGIWGQNNELHVKIETISVEKANSIAIYDNESWVVFNGHYQEKEKMNIIVLDINQDVSVSGTPFEYGPNVIVIPTRLFSETKLNGYIQNENLDQTPLYSDVEGEFEFISIGRNGTTEEGNDDIDFVIYRFNINANEAMQILTMIITVIENDTVEVERFGYFSTKENDVSSVMMNLHGSVLRYIPWYCNFKNSEQGEEPKNFLEFWAEAFVGTILSIGFFFYMIGMTIVQFFTQVIEAVLGEILMEILSFLALMLWLIIRAVLLIVFYILLAFEIIATIAIVVPMGVALMAIGAFAGWSVNWGVNVIFPYAKDTRIGHISIIGPQMNLNYESWVRWQYWEFFDMYIPIPEMTFDLGDIAETLSSGDEVPSSLNCGFKMIQGTQKYDFTAVYVDANGEAPSYMKLHLLSPSGIESEYNMQMNPDLDDVEWRDPAISKAMYKGGVLYNKTLNFSTLEQGQWFYYLATSNANDPDETRYPETIPYTIGPSLINYKDYLSVSFAGVEVWDNKFTNFTVVGYEYETGVYPDPDVVDLILILPDGSFTSIEMASVESFVIPDDPNEQNYPYANMQGTEYFVSVNMSDYYDFNEKSANVGYFFSASLTGGYNSILLDSGVSSTDMYFSSDDDFFDKPFEMYVRAIDKEKPQIVSYRVSELTSERVWVYEDVKDFRFGQNSLISVFSEDILRIEAWVRDEQGTHEEIWVQTPDNFTFVPQVTLNKGSKEETYDMMWMGYDEEMEADMYYVDINGFGEYSYDWKVDQDTGKGDWIDTSFGPGTWSMQFSVEDNDINMGTLMAHHEIRHSGSIISFLDTMWGGYGRQHVYDDEGNLAAGALNLFTIVRPYITFGGFVAASLVEFIGRRASADSGPTTAAHWIALGISGVTVVTDALAKFASLQSYADKNDPMGMLGGVLNMAISLSFMIITKSIMGLKNPLRPADTSDMDEFLYKSKSVGGTFSKIFQIFAALNFVMALTTDPASSIGALLLLMMSFATSKLSFKSVAYFLPFLSFAMVFLEPVVIKPILGAMNGTLSDIFQLFAPITNVVNFGVSGVAQIMGLLVQSMGIGIILNILEKLSTKTTEVVTQGTKQFRQKVFSPTTHAIDAYMIFEVFLMVYGVSMFFVQTS